ncbi:Multicopper oxidase [hydrothermal vent metagenome]|uniref:Multicopper oxidase n=1 Tax=hydrothermal vent metagenome TaxID=652676 RepID=A0A1W1CQ36_9ZZZZ
MLHKNRKRFKVLGLSLITIGLLSGCGSSDNTASSGNYKAFLVQTSLPSLRLLPVLSDEDANPNDNKSTYTLTANKNVDVAIETPNGNWVTPMWRYNNNTLPVIIKANRGENMSLKFKNKLSSDSTIHWHGFKIPADMDGGPDFPIAPNRTKLYSFTMDQPASSLWFHPHPDMQTGKQVYMGLAGVFILEDEISKGLEASNQLPSGDRDITLLVQDRRFANEANGKRELLYMNQEMDMDGMLGDKVLVNGSESPKLEVGTAKYRLRLYNVSNAKNYDFAFTDGRKFTIVGTDGGLLAKPVTVNHIFMGAAERVEIIADFSKDSVGSTVGLVSKAFEDDTMDMGATDTGGMDNMDNMDTNPSTNMSGRTTNGTAVNIMRFDVTKNIDDPTTIYTALPAHAEIHTRFTADNADNKGNERQFNMTMNMNGSMGVMSFVINGKAFDANRVDEFVGANSTEIWNITNNSPMAHPFHAHAIQWQILSRNGVKASGTDLGWKDTFLVKANESVKIIGKFEPVNQGDYMYHCHILEHEDAGMMGYFRVGGSGNVNKK